MTITALPQATVHLLGSSQTLTTSLSLVKELIDNALDANATSIDVLISQNTLDKVEVRDNGHGILPEDFGALGRRGHTSKLRSFDELKSIGGVTLGFRGEALASAVQLGEVTVTTKTEGEQVGNCVTLKAPGDILKQSRISHPVGTTVCVKNFISSIPVRRQVALKAAPKMLVKIKELLQSYALARPTIKFSLKIMKEIKGSWSFVPRPSEGIRGAATQVIGKDAAMECVEKTLAFPERKPSNSLMKDLGDVLDAQDDSDPNAKDNGFVVEMFLPKPDANLAKIGYGQYISVDSRPIANDKGTMKKIVILFKAYIKGSHSDTTDVVKNPFFRMNIICPVGSYDPNVEPAKDDVLFVNEDWVVESIESFFKEFYGEREKSTGSHPKQYSTRLADDFNLLLARERPAQAEISQELEETTATSLKPSTLLAVAPQENLSATRQTIDLADLDEDSDSVEEEDTLQAKQTPNRMGVDMSEDLSEDVEDLRPHPLAQSRKGNPLDHHQVQVEANGLGMNPWVIAKLTAPVRPRVDIVSTFPEVLDSPQFHDTPALPTPHHSSGPHMLEVRHRPAFARGPRQRNVSNPYHMTPAASRDAPGFELRTPPAQRLVNAPEFPEVPGTEVKSPLIRRQVHPPEVPEFGSVSLLTRRSVDSPEFEVDSPPVRRQVHASEAHAVPLENSQESSLLLVVDDAAEFTRRNDFISARNVTEKHIDRPTIPESVKLPKPAKKANLNRPFVSPLVNIPAPSRDSLRQTKLYGPPLVMEQPTDQEQDPDLGWSMDYENRKEEFTRQQRLKVKAARAKMVAEEAEANADLDMDIIRASPHKNRYQAALATLSQGEVQPEAQKTVIKRVKSVIPDGDPRAYLIRRQRSMSVHAQPGVAPKMNRLQSNRLPLERIPEKSELHSLILAIPTNSEAIRKLASRVGEVDTYIRNGSLGHGLVVSVADTPEFMRKIKDIAMKWKETKTEGDLEFDYSFGNLAQARIEMLR